ncbi:hypothetical protein SAMN05661012_06440 [Chitinophaga sancti]|uniref:Uncharacterized protein n=1 Tax=Chitinophaga sancti TaxID=1004 RepID=A0A1K1SYW1_9BACT|nr:hypothetical protein SAMN05661012_06440 [Chitinophaga sancti]
MNYVSIIVVECVKISELLTPQNKKSYVNQRLTEPFVPSIGTFSNQLMLIVNKLSFPV